MLVRRAFKVCTKDYLLEMELHHLETTFVEINNFPRNFVKRIFKQVRTETNVETQQPTTQLKKTLLSTNPFNVLFPTRAKRKNTS